MCWGWSFSGKKSFSDWITGLWLMGLCCMLVLVWSVGKSIHDCCLFSVCLCVKVGWRSRAHSFMVEASSDGTEAHIVVCLDRWGGRLGWPWFGFWTDSVSMDGAETLAGRNYRRADWAWATATGHGWKGKQDHLRQVSLFPQVRNDLLLPYVILIFTQTNVVVNGHDSKQTRVLLTSAAHFHLRQSDFSKHTRNLTPASRAILLSGPAGMPSGLCDLTLHLDI